MGKRKRKSSRLPKEKENKKSGIVFGKWQVVILLVISAISIYVGTKIQQWSTQKQLEYTVKPSCIFRFRGALKSGCDSLTFMLKNQGPGELDNIWFRELVFLVDSEGVHECPDLPHFEYRYYKGNPRSMGSLESGIEKEVIITSCWSIAFGFLLSKYQGELISRFRLTGSSYAVPEYKKDFFFVIDTRHCSYILPDDFVGGNKLVEQVRKYVETGPRSEIHWVGLIDGFLKNPKRWWYQREDGDYIPWGDTCCPPYELTRGKAIRFFPLSEVEFLPAEGGYVKFGWDCEEDTVPFVSMFGASESW
ncbi:MAG: hypothetical protein AMJ90_00590 [candidate division Zixibacteria bacterium SM23_73_2]|nr:MAG: hypothetical protein AMJ90_00590 [candidate division Zixibacteria bacterium SM23_73_2]